MPKPAATLEYFGELLAQETGLVTVATVRAAGTPLLSVVNAGIIDHPANGERVVAFVARGKAAKLRHIRANPFVAVVARRGWQWASAEGHAELFGPDDPHPDIDRDLAAFIREIFVAAGGTHDDFDEFDEVMRTDRRCAVLIRPTRIGTNRGS